MGQWGNLYNYTRYKVECRVCFEWEVQLLYAPFFSYNFCPVRDLSTHFVSSTNKSLTFELLTLLSLKKPEIVVTFTVLFRSTTLNFYLQVHTKVRDRLPEVGKISCSVG